MPSDSRNKPAEAFNTRRKSTLTRRNRHARLELECLESRVVPALTSLAAQASEANVGSIAGQLFNDLNRNARRDAGETALAGRTVFLDANSNRRLDSGEATATTDTMGTYRFGNLQPAAYVVAQILPSGWQASLVGGVSVTVRGGAQAWKDLGSFLPNAAPVDLPTGSIAGQAFNDLNKNSRRDAGETALGGRTVFLDTTSNGRLDAGEATAVTDAVGNYRFSNLNLGTYVIGQILPSGWQAAVGPSVTVRSGAQSWKDLGSFLSSTPPVDLPTGSIAGQVFNDPNRNARRDAGETALGGRTVFLDTNGNGRLDAGETSTTTDAVGNYRFGNLQPATYVVAQILPAGWQAAVGPSVTVRSGAQTWKDLGSFLSSAPPVAVADSVTTRKGQAVTVDVLLNDTAGDTLTVASFTSRTAKGTIGRDPGDPNKLVYTPIADATGEDSFTYTVEDARGGQATATVRVTIVRTNTAPLAQDDVATVVAGQSVTVEVLSNDSDPDGDSLTLMGFEGRSEKGTIVRDPRNPNRLVYTADNGAWGQDSFTYYIDDGNGNGLSDTARVIINLTRPPGQGTVRWSAGSGDWDDPASWSTGAVPGPEDDVVIDVPGDVTVTVRWGVHAVRSLFSTDTLKITDRGSLAVLSGQSKITGALNLTYGTLEVRGAGTTFEAIGPVTLNGAAVSARAGAVVRLPGATSVMGKDPLSRVFPKLEAEGAGSVLELPNLTSVSGPGDERDSRDLKLIASNGGILRLPGVTHLSTGRVTLYASGAGSVLDLPALETVTSYNTLFASAIQVQDGATLLASRLTTLDRVSLYFTGSWSMPTRQIRSVVNGWLTFNGGRPDLSGLTDITGSQVFARGGAVVELPALRHYPGGHSIEGQILEANGTGSVLSLPNLTSISGVTGGGTLYLRGSDAGTLRLPGVTHINSGRVWIQAEGGVVDLPALETFTIDGATFALDPPYYDREVPDNSIAVTRGGTLRASRLTTLDGVQLRLDENATMTTSQIRSVVNGQLVFYGSTPDLSNLTEMVNSSVIAGGGAVVRLPALAQYISGDTRRGFDLTLQADGFGSHLDLPNLTSLSGPTSGNPLALRASNGGTLRLPGVTSLDTGKISILAEGQGSDLDISGLETFATGIGNSIRVTGGAVLRTDRLTTLDRVGIALDGQSTMSTDQIRRYSHSTISIDGGSPDFNNLADISNASISVRGGGRVTLPALVQSQGGGRDTAFGGLKLTARGAGSVLDVPNLAIVTDIDGPSSEFTVAASDGGQVKLAALKQITATKVSFSADGAGEIELSTLEGLSATEIKVTNSGVMKLGALKQITATKGSLGAADGTSQIDLPALEQLAVTDIKVVGSVHIGTDTTTLAQGKLTLSQGAVLTTGVLVLSAGTTFKMERDTSVQGNLINHGIVQVNPAGQQRITGDYTQSVEGRLYLELADTEGAPLAVGGRVRLIGALFLSLSPGFAPALGDVIPMLQYGARSGSFNQFSPGPLISPYYIPTYGPNVYYMTRKT